MKIVNIIQVNYLRDGFDETDITEERYKESELKYGDTNQIVSEEHFNVEGVRSLLTLNQHNEAGKLMQSELYDADNEMVQRMKYSYDERGRMVKEILCYGKDSPEYGSHYVYENNLLVRQDVYDEDEFIYTEKIFEYRDDKMFREIDFTEEGEKQYLIEQEFNDKGLLTKRIRHELLDKDRRTCLYEYDEYDNKIKELILNYKGELIAKIYYAYNENRQLIEAEEEDLDHYKKLKYDYTGNLVSKVEEYNREGKLQQWLASHFDETGNLLKSEVFHIDEINPDQYRLVNEVRYEWSESEM
ncbi:MAG: hypothetical protein LBK03_07360 [Bacteroidales bacterium]|jgi:predicted transcriptional regulator|nr:hypothetical protein [Bacteroidales bacterium]